MGRGEWAESSGWGQEGRPKCAEPSAPRQLRRAKRAEPREPSQLGRANWADQRGLNRLCQAKKAAPKWTKPRAELSGPDLWHRTNRAAAKWIKSSGPSHVI